MGSSPGGEEPDAGSRRRAAAAPAWRPVWRVGAAGAREPCGVLELAATSRERGDAAEGFVDLFDVGGAGGFEPAAQPVGGRRLVAEQQVRDRDAVVNVECRRGRADRGDQRDRVFERLSGFVERPVRQCGVPDVDEQQERMLDLVRADERRYGGTDAARAIGVLRFGGGARGERLAEERLVADGAGERDRLVRAGRRLFAQPRG
jgi:hypothetical protein